MLYVVEYQIKGFTFKEKFKTLLEAEQCYDDIIEKLQDHLISIDLYRQ